jgi:hypothetical protein
LFIASNTNPKWDWKGNTNPYISCCTNYVIVILPIFLDLPRWDGILQKKLFNILLLIFLVLRDSFDLINYRVWVTFECFVTYNFFRLANVKWHQQLFRSEQNWNCRLANECFRGWKQIRDKSDEINGFFSSFLAKADMDIDGVKNGEQNIPRGGSQSQFC